MKVRDIQEAIVRKAGEEGKGLARAFHEVLAGRICTEPNLSVL